MTKTSRISLDSLFKGKSSPRMDEAETSAAKQLEVVEEASRQILEVGTSPYRSSQQVVPHDFG